VKILNYRNKIFVQMPKKNIKKVVYIHKTYRMFFITRKDDTYWGVMSL